MENTFGRSTLSDEEGRFAFSDLPSGKYVVGASKAAWVATEYGARRAGQSGTPIVLENGQQLEIALTLVPGGAIEGVVLDESGRPAERYPVSLLRFRTVAGVRRLESVSATTANLGFWGPLTDARGGYRFYGLPPGEYVVKAGLPPANSRTNAHPVTEEEMTRARRLLAEPYVRSQDSLPSFPPLLGARAPSPGILTQYVPVYFPGTPIALDATPIAVSPGEEKVGLDITIRRVRGVHVRGAVAREVGAIPTDAVVRLRSVGSEDGGTAGDRGLSVDRDGRFLFDGLAPGKYRVEAFTLGARSGDGPGVHTAEWAEADLLLDGSDQDGIVLTLRPTIRVSGTIVARRSAGPGAAVPTVEVFLLPERQDGGAASNTRAAVVQGNHFTLESVIPGRYRILAEVRPGLGPTQWAFDTGALDGREASDQSVEIGPADTAATIVLTDVASAVSGSVKTPGGRAVSDLSALVFSTSPSDWYWQSRRVEGVHLDTAGSFEVGGLPAGDYYLAVLRDIDSTDWYDPDLLRSVIPSAVTLRVTPGRRTTQDVQVLERVMFGY